MNNLGAPHDETVSDSKLILRPLIGLMNGLEPKEIELFVIEAVEKHRRVRDEAVKLEAILDREADSSDGIDTKRAYITAMIAVHAQQTVVSTLLDILGYIPETLRRKPH